MGLPEWSMIPFNWRLLGIDFYEGFQFRKLPPFPSTSDILFVILYHNRFSFKTGGGRRQEIVHIAEDNASSVFSEHRHLVTAFQRNPENIGIFSRKKNTEDSVTNVLLSSAHRKTSRAEVGSPPTRRSPLRPSTFPAMTPELHPFHCRSLRKSSADRRRSAPTFRQRSEVNGLVLLPNPCHDALTLLPGKEEKQLKTPTCQRVCPKMTLASMNDQELCLHREFALYSAESRSFRSEPPRTWLTPRATAYPARKRSEGRRIL